MAVRDDSFTPFDATLAAAEFDDPWTHQPEEPPSYAPDYSLLAQLLTIPVLAGKGWASGAFANGVDSWLAHELRRAGFGPDEVWPRATQPRILPRDIALMLDKLPRTVADDLRDRLVSMRAVAPTDAKILGRAYDKQVDVAIARWDRGPEVLISTKTQVSSFGKNLSNRFEEAYGDAGNLRSRYPLAAVGFFFVQRATILTEEPDAYERTVDMMRKLRDLSGSNGYTATGLALVSWSDEDKNVKLELDRVPDDVRPEQFMVKMIEQVLIATSVSQHVPVRNKLERRVLPLDEEDETTELA